MPSLLGVPPLQRLNKHPDKPQFDMHTIGCKGLVAKTVLTGGWKTLFLDSGLIICYNRGTGCMDWQGVAPRTPRHSPQSNPTRKEGIL